VLAPIKRDAHGEGARLRVAQAIGLARAGVAHLPFDKILGSEFRFRPRSPLGVLEDPNRGSQERPCPECPRVKPKDVGRMPRPHLEECRRMEFGTEEF
jgi:hypothetical protein